MALPENQYHDFGAVPRGTQLHYDFVMTNPCPLSMEILNARMSMFPATVQVDKNKLEPNEKANISVSMNTRAFSGAKSITIYVQLEIGKGAFYEVRLGLSAYSREDLMCDPGEVAFGSVAQGESPSQAVTFERTGQPGWAITEVAVPKDARFEATLKLL